MEFIASDSAIGRKLDKIPGFGWIYIGELAGEIGAIDRLWNQVSLALYLGMVCLDHSSGGSRRSKRNT